MKKIVFLSLFIILSLYTILVYAGTPYLVCDPQPNTGVEYYVISGLPSGLDGSNIPLDSTKVYGFKFPISAWPSDGKTYTLIAYACNKTWGVCSNGSSPLELSRPLLSIPTNVKMSVQ